MKKSLLIALLPLLLGGCSLQEGYDSVKDISFSFNEDDLKYVYLSVGTIFMQVGDSYDLALRIVDDEGKEIIDTSKYTLRPSNGNVLIEGTRITAVSNGYTDVTISGPALKKPVDQTIFIGSIEGTYTNTADFGTPLTLALLSNQRFSWSHDVLETSERNYEAFAGVGSYTSEYSCLATLAFEGNADAAVQDIIPTEYNFFDFRYNAVFEFDSVTEKLAAYLNVAGRYVKLEKR